MDEIWHNLNILKFSCYYVSSYGKIFSMKSNKILKNKKDSNGYIRLSLINDDGLRCTLSVHVLVATIFCIKPNNDKCSVDHINRITDDNRSSNLRWVTSSEQAFNREKRLHQKGASIIQYDIDYNFIRKWGKHN
jgi:hypothetical protein